METKILDFYKKLEKKTIFEGEIFDFENQNINIGRLNSDGVTFEHCTFNCKDLNFSNLLDETLRLEFESCTFNCNVNFSNCTFIELSFKNTEKIDSLNLGSNSPKNKIYSFQFSNDSKTEKLKLTTDFNIRNIVFEIFSFQNITHVEGRFIFLGNRLGENTKQINDIISFQNSTISNMLFGTNSFFKFTSFRRAEFKFTPKELKPAGSAYEFPGFYKNTFNKVSFSGSNFDGRFQFENCDFLGTAIFEECKNLSTSHLKLKSCKFEKYSLFDNSKFDKIEILHSKFLEKASFENFETNHFKIHQVTFSEVAYFDDLNKNNNGVIENWDRKTLRAIKRELVNSHNQIDYLRFKAYELIAYKKEVDQYKLNWKDSLILYFNEDSNYFGLDWTKGIRFIFQWSLIFYLLYIISYSASIDDFNCIPRIEDLATNYLKFTNPLSFLDTPLENSEDYFLPLLFISLSKIFVSYGIYQTIQAFRKFGVNGG